MDDDDLDTLGRTIDSLERIVDTITTGEVVAPATVVSGLVGAIESLRMVLDAQVEGPEDEPDPT